MHAVVDGHMNSAEVTAFKREAGAIAEKLVQEHCRETMALYNDNQKIKAELARVVDMMNNFLQREKQLHDMLASLTDSHGGLLSGLHGKVTEAVGAGSRIAGDHKSRAGEMLNLHQATVQELARIQRILGSPSAGSGHGSPLSLSPQPYSPPMQPPVASFSAPPQGMMAPAPMPAPAGVVQAPMQVPPGYAAALVYGEDRNRNGIPDIMEQAPAPAAQVFRMI